MSTYIEPFKAAITAFLAQTKEYAITAIKPRLLEIGLAPIRHPNMIWTVLPLFISLFLMQMYFARHKREELGWNTAFGNSVALIFVSFSLLQYLTGLYGFLGLFNYSILAKTGIAAAIGVMGFMQMFLNFMHWMPKKLAFFISSGPMINLTAYMGIVLVHTTVPIDLVTLLTAILIFDLILIAFRFLKKLMPAAHLELDELEKEEVTAGAQEVLKAGKVLMKKEKELERKEEKLKKLEAELAKKAKQ